MVPKRFTPHARKLFAAIGETFIPPRHAGDWHGGDDTSLAVAEQFFSSGPWFMRLTFLLCAFVFQHTPLFTLGRVARFTALSGPERLAHMHRFALRMPFALVFAPLRAFVGVSVYSRPDAAAETGYENVGHPRPLPRPKSAA